MRAWRAAADRAPDDGSEEAAYHLYQEQRHLPPAIRKELRPDSALRLAAALEFEPAAAALRRRLSREAARRKSERRRQAREGGAGKKEKFIRNDKARTMTNREVQRTGDRRHTQLVHLTCGKKSGMQMQVTCRVQTSRQPGLHKASWIS